ncbi:alanine aminotransferase 1-like isoform X2 [Convolutriloba macropyga]
MTVTNGEAPKPALYGVGDAKNASTANWVPVLSGSAMNPNVKNVQYAVRGPIVQKATKYDEMIKSGNGGDLPFGEVIKANIGDCQAMLQKPITFLRQVLSACLYPDLLDISPPVFPNDVIERAKEILGALPGGSLGSYSESTGHLYCRKIVKTFIETRDGYPADVNNVILSNGASEIIKLTLLTATFGVGKGRTGVMIPIPQYPLYSATISEIGAEKIDYYLDEEDKWSLSIDELAKSFKEAQDYCTPRVLCVINPGNPTGQVLKRENIDEIIKFAAEHQLVLMADEVYQDNVYDADSEFCSFKKALMELPQYKDRLELVSFHSMSKGFMGECGIRGGYAEFINFDSEVMTELKKLKSAQLCSAVSGQVALSIVLNPPKPGEESYELFMNERSAVLGTLKSKSVKVHDLFSRMPGMRVNPIMGAMYCFPRIELPQKAIDEAKEAGVAPDAFYVEKLLESTGICVVPGSGFGQLPDTYHFRTTILPPEDKIEAMLKKFEEFHVGFIEQYK